MANVGLSCTVCNTVYIYEGLTNEIQYLPFKFQAKIINDIFPFQFSCVLNDIFSSVASYRDLQSVSRLSLSKDNSDCLSQTHGFPLLRFIAETIHCFDFGLSILACVFSWDGSCEEPAMNVFFCYWVAIGYACATGCLAEIWYKYLICLKFSVCDHWVTIKICHSWINKFNI